MPTEGLTADKLYELFMDKDVDFAEDLYSYFGDGDSVKAEQWGKDYGMYFTPFDESALELDKRQRDLDYKKARMTSEITQEATDRAYRTEQDKLRTGVEKNLKSAKSAQGRLGLRSGSLDTMIEDTIESSGDEVKNLADRLVLSRQAEKDKYNMAMVDAALDYDQDVRDEKEAFYDRTMSRILDLIEKDARDFGINFWEEGVDYSKGSSPGGENQRQELIEGRTTPHDGTIESCKEYAESLGIEWNDGLYSRAHGCKL